MDNDPYECAKGGERVSLPRILFVHSSYLKSYRNTYYIILLDNKLSWFYFEKIYAYSNSFASNLCGLGNLNMTGEGTIFFAIY